MGHTDPSLLVFLDLLGLVLPIGEWEHLADSGLLLVQKSAQGEEGSVVSLQGTKYRKTPRALKMSNMFKQKSLSSASLRAVSQV